MSDLAKNLRKICETEELKRLIDELQFAQKRLDKDGIDKTIYFAYQNTTGGISSGNGSINNELGSEEVATESTDAALDALSGDILNEFGDASDAGAFDKDIADIYSDGLKAGEKVKAITGIEDCTSGKEAEIILDDNHRPPNLGGGLNGYKATDWDEGNDPREAQWRSGVWYNYAGVTATYASNPYASIAAYLPTWDSLDPGNAPHTFESLETYDVDAESDGGTIEATIGRATGGSFSVNITIKKTGCVVGTDLWCPSSKPVNNWPSDSKHQLKFTGGQFKTSQFENSSDLNGPWQNDPSKISGCTSGGGQVSLQATNDGGMLINIEDGANAGDSILVGADGFVKTTVTDATPYLPSDS